MKQLVRSGLVAFTPGAGVPTRWGRMWGLAGLLSLSAACSPAMLGDGEEGTACQSQRECAANLDCFAWQCRRTCARDEDCLVGAELCAYNVVCMPIGWDADGGPQGDTRSATGDACCGDNAAADDDDVGGDSLPGDGPTGDEFTCPPMGDECPDWAALGQGLFCHEDDLYACVLACSVDCGCDEQRTFEQDCSDGCSDPQDGNAACL